MQRQSIAGILAAVILMLAADVFLFYTAEIPRIENAAEQKQWEGLDLLAKYRENPDMAGWLQVEGTDINYPVMRSDAYLHRDFKGSYNDSGSLFVEEDWTEKDLCTLVYGHNMWMYGTMFHQLHRFREADFFRGNRTIKFYVIEDGGLSAEKRTYEIQCCSRTSVEEWNYASCQYICSEDELDAFERECRDRALQMRDGTAGYGGAIVLSTCSYHIRGGKGRLLLVGALTDRREQTKLDVKQRTKTD